MSVFGKKRAFGCDWSARFAPKSGHRLEPAASPNNKRFTLASNIKLV
jgi:hypothetical protein